jgi:thiol-disulfide isomerase/thioredoxin
MNWKRGLAVRVVPLLIMAYVGLGLASCSTFGKKSNGGDKPAAAPNGGGKTPAKFPTDNDPLFKSATNITPAVAAATTDTDHRTLLAGTVIDAYNQRPREALVSYICLDDGKPKGAPIDVTVDGQGYFTIRGLEPDKSYKLVARAKEGEKVIVGVTYAKPPNVRLLIRMSENLNSGDAPGFPDPPVYKGKDKDAKDDKKATLAPPEKQGAGNWQPTTAAALNSGHLNVGLGVPRPLTEPELPGKVNVPPPVVPPPPPPDGGWVPGIAGQQRNWPPMMEIRKPMVQIKPLTPLPETPPISPPATNGAPLPAAPPTPNRDSGTTYATPLRVPSCVLVKPNLETFTLNDLNGQAWDFKTHRRGKLVLLDFWGTWCGPCQRALPFLGSLQSKYPDLEVIGIACEVAGTPQEQAYRVNAVCKSQNVSYRQLLGTGANCPVQKQFGIHAYPSLFLLDETGRIIWEGQGLDGDAKVGLELLIQRKLGLR